MATKEKNTNFLLQDLSISDLYSYLQCCESLIKYYDTKAHYSEGTNEYKNLSQELTLQFNRREKIIEEIKQRLEKI